MKRFLLFSLAIGMALSWASALQAQNRPYFPFFQQEYWFGHLPNIRAEAMGRADVAVGGTVASRFYNAAGIGLVDDWAADVSTSAPFYLLTASDFYFAGFAKRLHPKLVVAASLHQLAVGPTGFTVDIGTGDFPLDKPKSSTYTATVAAEPLPGLHVGVNANYYRMKFFDDVSPAGSFFLDGGLLYELPLTEGQSLRFGLGVSNATFDEISFESPTGERSSNFFPVIARAGISYLQDFTVEVPGAGAQKVGLLLTTEYQDLLNNDFRTAFRLGSEVTLAEVLALRMGFFTQSEDDFDQPNNRDRVNDFTYGFGFILPMGRLSKGKLPFRLHLDYYSLQNPPVVFSGSRRSPNKRGFGIRLVSNL